MDFWKFEDLLTRSSLCFARADRFKDPFEGRFSPGNEKRRSPSDEAFHALYRIGDIEPEALELHRRCVFISCWHRNTKEDREMWKAYTSGPESLVITTSGKALYRFIPDDIEKSPVKYRGHEFPRTAFTWNSIFFYKPTDYRIEREFRLLRNLGKDETVNFDDPADNLRYIPIRLSKIIHRVITHPEASNEFKSKVEAVIQKHMKHRRREDSTLL